MWHVCVSVDIDPGRGWAVTGFSDTQTSPSCRMLLFWKMFLPYFGLSTAGSRSAPNCEKHSYRQLASDQ